MSKDEQVIRAKKGQDPWSGRHPICGRRAGSWWRRYLRKILRIKKKNYDNADS